MNKKRFEHFFVNLNKLKLFIAMIIVYYSVNHDDDNQMIVGSSIVIKSSSMLHVIFFTFQSFIFFFHGERDRTRNMIIISYIILTELVMKSDFGIKIVVISCNHVFPLSLVRVFSLSECFNLSLQGGDIFFFLLF